MWDYHLEITRNTNVSDISKSVRAFLVHGIEIPVLKYIEISIKEVTGPIIWKDGKLIDPIYEKKSTLWVCSLND
jgi:hypothetical protein